MTNIVRIFTDGSAIGNPGPGGWGAVVIQGSKRREMSGAFPRATISEMELLAAVEALRSIPPGTRVELHADYVCLALREVLAKCRAGETGLSRPQARCLGSTQKQRRARYRDQKIPLALTSASAADISSGSGAPVNGRTPL